MIKTFHRKTALIQAGVLQRSADAVSPRLRVDFLGPSDAPLNRGGWAARKERQAAADACAAGAGAPAGAPPAAPAPSLAAAAGAGGAAPADMPPASAPDAATRCGVTASPPRAAAAPRRPRRRAALLAASPAGGGVPDDWSSVAPAPTPAAARALRSRLARTRRPTPAAPLRPRTLLPVALITACNSGVPDNASSATPAQPVSSVSHVCV